MFRTRDFLMIFTAVVFLLIAIGTTLLRQHIVSSEHTATLKFAETTNQEFTAEIEEEEEVPLSREERVVKMRDKIAASEELVLPVSETITVDEVLEEEVEDEESSLAMGVQKCSGHASYLGYWSPQGVEFEVAEGARVVYRVGTEIFGTTTVASREVLFQLPVAPFKSGEYCLATDVIGIAQDGSLIKNDEIGLYGVFGEQTLIGYALDGFPIYGVSAVATDACGGAMVAGSYGYYLSDEREAILNCFAAAPTTF